MTTLSKRLSFYFIFYLFIYPFVVVQVLEWGDLGLISHRLVVLSVMIPQVECASISCQLLEVVRMLFAYKKVGWGGWPYSTGERGSLKSGKYSPYLYGELYPHGISRNSFQVF